MARITLGLGKKWALLNLADTYDRRVSPNIVNFRRHLKGEEISILDGWN